MTGWWLGGPSTNAASIGVDPDYGQTLIPLGLSNVVAIAAGAAHTLILRANGKLVAWGDNTYGQTTIPANLTNGSVVAIAAGGWHNLALKSDGTVVAWGAGLGTNVNVDYHQNSVPTGLTNVVQIAAGMLHSLTLSASSPPTVTVPLTIKGLGTNGVTLSLPTRNGRVYQLAYTSSLTAAGWSPFPLQAGLGNALLFVDPARPVAQRFYRVSQW